MNQTDSRGFPEVNTNVAWLYSMYRPSFLWPVWLFVASDIFKCNKSLPLRYTILQLGYAHVSKGSSYHLSVVNQIVQFCYGKWTKHTKQKHDKPTFETAFNLLWGRSLPETRQQGTFRVMKHSNESQKVKMTRQATMVVDTQMLFKLWERKVFGQNTTGPLH